MHCISCGTTLPEGATFCPTCGAATFDVTGETEELDRSSLFASTTVPFDPASTFPEAYYSSLSFGPRLQNPYESPSLSKTLPPPRRRIKVGLLTSILLILLILLSGGVFAFIRLHPPAKTHLQKNHSTAAAPARVHPTASPTPGSGTTLYQADWSQGLDGWVGTAGWKVQGGMLVNNGADNPSGAAGPTVLAPYQLGAGGNFAIEVRVQEMGTGCFDPLLFHGSSVGGNWQGYKVTVCGDIRLTSDSFTDILGQAAFNPGESWHTYRLEVRGSWMALIVDGTTRLTAQDTRFLSGGQVGMKTSVPLMVSSFKIMAFS